MNIAILGGIGMMGQGILRDLLSDRAIIEIERIVVCDLDMERITAFIETLGDPRLEAKEVDVTDATQLRAALASADLCINAVPTLAGHQMVIFETCLGVGVDYLDLGGLGTYTVKQLEYHDRFRDSGVMAVLGAGADPGMSNVLCRAVADELDQIDRINLYWAAESVGPESPVLLPPYSVSTVLAEYAHPSTQFLNGKHVECAPMNGVETLDLPEPWGHCEFMYSPHSEQLTVPLADGIREKGIREFTWKLHLPHREHEAWIGLVKAGFGDFDRVVSIGGNEVRPIDVLNAVIQRNMIENAQDIPEQDSHEIHFAIGRGTKDGKEHAVKCQVVVRPDSMYDGYIDACTSMNASIAAQLMFARGSKPGVWAPEEFFRPADYFPELEKRRFQVSTSVL
ncbi:saccharopine dehydrogenase family protein [Roseovarius sp. 2305UL8-3]|uniref:saccharopine dehydrogenase family protein n=1 Tax=Roseovarius conchicola TaxID=3121636 RepID=UPI003526DE27